MAVEHDIAHRVAGDVEGVQGAADGGEKIAFGDHGGVHAGLDPVAMIFADGQQLDPVAELAGKVDIQRGDLGDALDVDVIEIHFGPVGQ
jgi:hypothetical protein